MTTALNLIGESLDRQSEGMEVSRMGHRGHWVRIRPITEASGRMTRKLYRNGTPLNTRVRLTNMPGVEPLQGSMKTTGSTHTYPVVMYLRMQTMLVLNSVLATNKEDSRWGQKGFKQTLP